MALPKNAPVKKAIAKQLIICLVFFLIGVAVIVVSTFFGEFAIVGYGFGGIIILASLISLSAIKDIKLVHCPDCGEKFNYQRDVSCVESDIITKAKSEQTVVEFECHCEKCNRTVEFTKKFTTATVDKNGNVKESNIETLVRKFFK